MITTEVRENLATVLATGQSLLDALDVELSMKFVRKQGPQSVADGAPGRTFSVSGAKADNVRRLIFADQGFTRKELAELAGCSVSRVAEVVWGLEHDGVDFPEIPLRNAAPVAEQPQAHQPNMPRE